MGNLTRHSDLLCNDLRTPDASNVSHCLVSNLVFVVCCKAGWLLAARCGVVKEWQFFFTFQVTPIDVLLDAALNDPSISVQRVALFALGTIVTHPAMRQRQLTPSSSKYIERLRQLSLGAGKRVNDAKFSEYLHRFFGALDGI